MWKLGTEAVVSRDAILTSSNVPSQQVDITIFCSITQIVASLLEANAHSSIVIAMSTLHPQIQ